MKGDAKCGKWGSLRVFGIIPGYYDTETAEIRLLIVTHPLAAITLQPS